MIKERVERKEVTKHYLESNKFVIVYKDKRPYFKLINLATKNYLCCSIDCEEDINELIELLEKLKAKL